MKKIFLLTLLFGLGSCGILDQVSPNDVDANNVFISEEGANSALTGMYATMQSRDYYGGYFPMIADLHSDVGTAGGFFVIALEELSALEVTESNFIIENTWLAIYNTISTANAIIANVPGISDPDFTAEEKDHVVGQAKTIRALGHFDLLRLFGEHWDLSSSFGIPVVTTIQTADDVVSRSTVAQTYTAILADLNDAFTLIIADDRNQSLVNPMTVKALQARVKLYKGDDMAGAEADAQAVIDDGAFSLMDATSFQEIYNGRLSAESIFELTFDVQNRSSYNSITYSRGDALRTEVLFLVEESMNDFFNSRAGDLRSSLVDFNPDNNSSDIIPDGRSQKYRGEDTRDNPAYIIRMAELYLIIAEAQGLAGGGIDELNEVRINRGLPSFIISDFDTEADFLNAVLDERKAELNFEGHRMFDLARTGNTDTILDIDDFRSIIPIPLRELTATNGAIVQNPGYAD